MPMPDIGPSNGLILALAKKAKPGSGSDESKPEPEVIQPEEKGKTPVEVMKAFEDFTDTSRSDSSRLAALEVLIKLVGNR